MTMSWKQHNDLYICVLLKLKYYEYSNNKYIKWIQYTKFHHHFSYSRTIYDQLKLVLCHMSINCGDMFTLFWRNITIFWYHTFWRWSRVRDRGEKKARWGSVFLWWIMNIEKWVWNIEDAAGFALNRKTAWYSSDVLSQLESCSFHLMALSKSHFHSFSSSIFYIRHLWAMYWL